MQSENISDEPVQDEAISISNFSLTNSVSTSLRPFADPASVEEYGRTFNGYREGKYLLPDDKLEQERQEVEHSIWVLLLGGKTGLAPIEKSPAKVLDIATGTGIWAIKFSEENPESTVFGTDISLMQPDSGLIPENCFFIREDATDEWVFGHLFDYVHLRSTSYAFVKPREMMETVFANLVPGGWVEYQDYSTELVGKNKDHDQRLHNSARGELWDIARKGFEAAGLERNLPTKYKAWMTEVGFVDVVEKVILCPQSPFLEDSKNKEIGELMEHIGIQSGPSCVKMLRSLGMSADELDRFLERYNQSVLDRSLHVYVQGYIVYGRKPLE